MIHYTFAQTAKTWTSLIGTVLTLIVPWALQVSQTLPAPWPAVVAGIMAILTAMGVYKVPNAPRPNANQTYSEPTYSAPVSSGYNFPWPNQ
jgi:hypothetical protein